MNKSDSTLFSYRRLNLAGFCISGAALAYASVSLEQQLSAINCSLCSIVRLCLLCMTGIFFLAFLHNPWKFGQRFYGLINWLIAIIGLATGGRYVWLDSQAETTSLCSTGLETWTSTVPFLSDIHHLLIENNECLDNSWQQLGLSLPQITTAVFALLFLITWRVLTRSPRAKLLF
ncbi:disulfide bond formation protein B [Neptunomonas sp.]|uniref:disulfide bond formation protein B n=1 Tax=Neptunomonas sp. TaxID=1971898 RepID=UPI0025E77F44|nr:disulfide bond formation protein B [Neptunomonas sp.]